MSLLKLRRNGIYSVKIQSSLGRKEMTSMEFLLIGLGTYLGALIFNGVAIAVSCLSAAVVAMIIERFRK